ncbi:MAG: VOC family protein [Candidatus Rokubacteria bacterium]|nr:VOC family protein [Candidatus Rokubacteria bacterium]
MPGTRFDHIAIGLQLIADAPATLAGVLGGQPDKGMNRPAFNWATWRFAGGGVVEILEPAGRDGFMHRFLASRGPGIHHVTFTVPSLAAACARARAQGYQIVGLDDSDPGWKEAFLHPKQAQGIVVQLAESSGDGEARRPPPPGPPDPPPPVTLVGLRLAARSREGARRQWEQVLEGTAREGAGGELIYRWPDSPMRLVVEIDDAAAEGPLAIEIASDRAVALPDGPHPVLGAVFRRVTPGDA